MVELESSQFDIAGSPVTVEELDARFGLKISGRTIELHNISPDEASYIQSYPMLNGPNIRLNWHLRRKLHRPENWVKLSSTVGSEAWNSRDLKSRPH